jgi:hypothetical protein
MQAVTISIADAGLDTKASVAVPPLHALGAKSARSRS